MSDENALFLEACGGDGPLHFEWNDSATGDSISRDLSSPAVLVGWNPMADLVLGSAGVSKRHAYLQLIEGRLYAIDLGSREGLRWGKVPRSAGWIDPRQPLAIGESTLQVVGGTLVGESTAARPSPTSNRYVSGLALPGVMLQVRGEGGETRRGRMGGALVLVGGSERCGVRLDDPGSSRFACGLVRTPAGVWVVDLLSSQGVTLNGAACRLARLEDGDVIRVGRRTIRVLYDGMSAPSGARAKATPSPTAPPSSLAPAVNGLFMATGPQPPARLAGGDHSPEAILQPLLERGGPGPGSSSPFGEALVMMVRLMGDVHRDQLALIREEVAELRQLRQEMAALRDQTPRAAPKPLAPPAPSPPEQADTLGEPVTPPRPTPEAVRTVVGERLEAWERERRSPWRKILNLLVKP